MTRTQTNIALNVPALVLGTVLTLGAVFVFALLTESNEVLGTDAFGRSLVTFIGITAFGTGASLLLTSVNEDGGAVKNLLGATVSIIVVGVLGLLATILVYAGILPLSY